MAEGYQGLDKGYFVRKQSDLQWVQTFRMTLRSPAVANRIFDTKQHAIDFINDTSDAASAIEGLILAVYKDETFGNNGLYFVKSIKETIKSEDESGNTIFIETEDGTLLQIYDSDNNKPIGLQDVEDNISETNKNLQDIENSIYQLKETIGLTENLTLPEDFEYDTIIEGINSKQDILTAGTNISISGNTISSTYEFDDTDVKNEIATVKTDITSLNTNKQDKLTAGTNISISGNTISSTYEFDDTYLQNQINDIQNSMVFSGITAQEEIIVNSPLGNYKMGDTISSNNSLMDVIRKLLTQTIQPEYISAPTCTLINTNNSSKFGTYEVGTVVEPKLNYTYTDGSYKSFKKGSSTQTETLLAGCTESSHKYLYGNTELTENNEGIITKRITLEDGTTSQFKVAVTYNAAKNKPLNSNGEECTGYTSGVCYSTNYTYTGRYYYFGGCTNDIPTDSNAIRALKTYSGWLPSNSTVTQTTATSTTFTYVVGCVPQGCTVTLQNGFGENLTMTKGNDVTVNIGGTSTQKYSVFYVKTGTANFKNLTIIKGKITNN